MIDPTTLASDPDDDDYNTPQPTRTQRWEPPGAPARPGRPPLMLPPADEPVVPVASRIDVLDLPKLDLVFTIDKTGSMGPLLNSMKTNFRKIYAELADAENYDVRFGLVVYQDWAQEGTDEDGSNVVDSWRFTWDDAEFMEHMGSIVAGGGGDGPEAVECGLKRALDMDWREDAVKVCILIGDAPPHGLGETNDAFKAGAPEEDMDVFCTLERMYDKGIRVYGIGCEPALSDLYLHGSDFWFAAAYKTGGLAIALKAPSALAEVVIGCAVTEVDYEDVYNHVRHEAELLHLRDPPLSPKTVLERVYKSMEDAWPEHPNGFTAVRHMNVSSMMKGTPSAMKLAQAKTLGEARALLGLDALTASPPETDDNNDGEGGGGTYSVYRGMSGCTLDAPDDELDVNCAVPKPEAKAPAPFRVAIEEHRLTLAEFKGLYEARLWKETFWLPDMMTGTSE
jgi:hypothetical protein